jgi:hypothetical protein
MAKYKASGKQQSTYRLGQNFGKTANFSRSDLTRNKKN